MDLVFEKLKSIPNLDVYKKEEIPESLKYKYNVRIGDIIIVSRPGFATYLKKIDIDWSVTNGDHGYYNNQSSMFPMFIAHGPAFKKDFKIKSFNNVDLYPLMCLILGVKPAYNNGSLDNVVDMLEYYAVEDGFSYGKKIILSKIFILEIFITWIFLVFVLLLLIPICLISLTVLFVCFSSRNSLRDNNFGYSTVSTSEAVAIPIENEYDDRTRLIGRLEKNWIRFLSKKLFKLKSQ